MAKAIGWRTSGSLAKSVTRNPSGTDILAAASAGGTGPSARVTGPMIEKRPSISKIRGIDDPLDDPILAGDLGVPPGAELGGPLLSVVVDPDDPEPLAISLGPLEVVHQRPEEVTPDVVPLGDRPVEADQV